MKNTIECIKEALRIKTGSKVIVNQDKDLDELFNKVKEIVEDKLRSNLHAIAQTKLHLYIIYDGLRGYKAAPLNLETKKLADYPKATKAYGTIEEVIAFVEKNWSFNKDEDKWYWGRDENKQQKVAPKTPNRPQPTSVGETNLAFCKNAKEIILKLAEYLQISMYSIKETKIKRYGADIKAQMIQYRDKEILIYDGTYQGSYSAKGYARKKGFTVRLNIDDGYGYKYTDLDYRLGPQGDDFISWWGRRNETVKSLVERIDKMIDKEKK